MAALEKKWLVVTNKVYKPQVKREVGRILKGVTLQIMSLTYAQPGTISKEHYNPTFVTYAAALQVASENGPKTTNVATPRQIKRNLIIIFNVLDTESYPKLPQKEENYTNKQDDQENNSTSNETAPTWRKELQHIVVETTKLLEKKRH